MKYSPWQHIQFLTGIRQIDGSISGSVVNTAYLLWWFPVSFFWTNNFAIVCTASLVFCDCNHHCCNVIVGDDLWKEGGSWQNQVIEMSTAGSRWYAVTSWFVCRVGCGDVWYKNTSWIVCETLPKKSRYFFVCQRLPDFFLSYKNRWADANINTKTKTDNSG